MRLLKCTNHANPSTSRPATRGSPSSRVGRDARARSDATRDARFATRRARRAPRRDIHSDDIRATAGGHARDSIHFT